MERINTILTYASLLGVLCLALLLQQDHQPLKEPLRVVQMKGYTKKNEAYIRIRYNHTQTIRKLAEIEIIIEEKPTIHYDGTNLTMNTRNWLSLEESFEKH